MTAAATFGLAFVITAVAIAGLAVGVMFGRRPIQGSCGGASDGCELCSSAGRCRRGSERDAADGEG